MGEKTPLSPQGESGDWSRTRIGPNVPIETEGRTPIGYGRKLEKRLVTSALRFAGGVWEKKEGGTISKKQEQEGKK